MFAVKPAEAGLRPYRTDTDRDLESSSAILVRPFWQVVVVWSRPGRQLPKPRTGLVCAFPKSEWEWDPSYGFLFPFGFLPTLRPQAGAKPTTLLRLISPSPNVHPNSDYAIVHYVYIYQADPGPG